MKNNFSTTAQEELIEVEIRPIEQHSHQGGFALKGNPIVRHTINETPKAGYGHCRSCDCKGYISKHNGSHECKNCNHHFDRHN